MNNVAFIVTCREYEHLEKLTGTENDAEIIRKALIENCGCSEPYCETIVGAHGAEIFTSLEKFSEEHGNDVNNFFFYYSGHGASSDVNTQYILPEDTYVNQRPRPNRAFSFQGKVIVQELTDEIWNLFNPRNTIIILDMCLEDAASSGGSSKGINIIHPNCSSKSARASAGVQNTTTIFACLPGEASFCDKDGSFFTRCFTQSLSNPCESKPRDKISIDDILNTTKGLMDDLLKDENRDQEPFAVHGSAANLHILSHKPTDPGPAPVDEGEKTAPNHVPKRQPVPTVIPPPSSIDLILNYGKDITSRLLRSLSSLKKEVKELEDYSGSYRGHYYRSGDKQLENLTLDVARVRCSRSIRGANQQLNSVEIIMKKLLNKQSTLDADIKGLGDLIDQGMKIVYDEERVDGSLSPLQKHLRETVESLRMKKRKSEDLSEALKDYLSALFKLVDVGRRYKSFTDVKSFDSYSDINEVRQFVSTNDVKSLNRDIIQRTKMLNSIIDTIMLE